jgi:hypothetical protein
MSLALPLACPSGEGGGVFLSMVNGDYYLPSRLEEWDGRDSCRTGTLAAILVHLWISRCGKNSGTTVLMFSTLVVMTRTVFWMSESSRHSITTRVRGIRICPCQLSLIDHTPFFREKKILHLWLTYTELYFMLFKKTLINFCLN